jgi:hypothetical protein
MKEQIFELLKQKPHNIHYLNRYYQFVLRCQEANIKRQETYTENHHILPKAKDMFPQYSNFTLYPENCAILTFRQHFLAHYMLMKAYGTRSQILSVIRTSGQPHIKQISLKYINTKILQEAKTQLSNKMKGKFAGVYDKNGQPLVKDETKQKLSKIKTEFYKNIENRKKQSFACAGKKRKNTENIRLAALRRKRSAGDIYATNMKVTIENKKKEGTWNPKPKKGLFITPIGVLSNLTNSYRHWCLNPDKPLTIHAAKKSTLCSKKVVGMTPRELGFYFIKKDDPQFSKWYALMNQVHQPEPSHPLSLELNDFLLRENLLLQK